MPEFILNDNAAASHPFYALDDFAKGYVEAMFFTNGDTGDEREGLLNELGVERLTRASVANIKAACDAFQKENAASLALAYERDGYDSAQAGRDFWFTRQGHGVGYWDRKQLEPDSEEYERLTAAMVANNAAWVDPGSKPHSDEWGRLQGLRSKLKESSLGQLLTIAAHRVGETYPECYRGWIHHH